MTTPEEKRPTCRRCFRPEASQEDWGIAIKGHITSVHRCWRSLGGDSLCTDRRDERIAELEAKLARASILVATIKDFADAGMDADALTNLPCFKDLDQETPND
jgi:hypothetical protein